MRPAHRGPWTATLSGNGQLTLPAALCRAKGLAPGTRIDVFPLPEREGFVAIVRRLSRILAFAGDLPRSSPPDRKEGPV